LKIAIVGPPRSGKSIITATLLFFLRDSLNEDARHVQTDVKDIVVPQIIKGKKPVKKEAFNLEEFYESLRKLKNAKGKIILTDAPGRLTKQLDDLIQIVDAIIFVHKSLEAWRKDTEDGRSDSPEEWKNKLREWGKPIILEIETYLEQKFGEMVLNFKEKKCRIPITTGRKRGIMTNHSGLLAIAHYVKEYIEQHKK